MQFGNVGAATFTVNSDSQIAATAPAEQAGIIDITITTPSGTSALTSADRFTFGSFSTPSVAGVSPISGASTGGTSVSITGAGFSGATAVRFGSAAASSFTVTSSGLITATAPAGTTTVDVTVTNPAGTSAVTPADEYTFTFANNGYAVSLAGSTTTPAVGGSVALTATANKDVGPTPYGLSILDATTGVEIIHAGSGTTLSTSVSQSAASTHRYVGFVSNANAANAQAASSSRAPIPAHPAGSRSARKAATSARKASASGG